MTPDTSKTTRFLLENDALVVDISFLTATILPLLEATGRAILRNALDTPEGCSPRRR